MKLLFTALFVAALSALVYLPAGADDNGAVEILVTPKVIAISVDQTQLDYGSPEIGTTDNRPNPVGFNVTNNSTVAVKLQIMGDDTTAVGGGAGWTLGTVAGSDTYVHRYAVNVASPSYPGEFGLLKKDAEDFLASVAVGASANLKLSLDMPTSTSTLVQQTAPVTVIAMEATP